MTGVQLTLDEAHDTRTVRSKLPPVEQWALACQENPGLREAWADTARQLQQAGVRATANRVAEELRGRFRTVGGEYAFNNTWRRPAADELRRTDPDAARHMTARGNR